MHIIDQVRTEEFWKEVDIFGLNMVRESLRDLIKYIELDIQKIYYTQLGSASDYEKEFGDMPVGKLVRKIIGLDRTAANDAFSQFLNNEILNTTQINFVKMIVDYVVVNGFIEDNSVLMQDPFRSVGSITQLFRDNMDDVREIMGVIEQIRRNSEEVV
ncbi:type I restriction-modification enzyme R subunit C-terminal domain-containing protein [Terrisporobacter sp.]